MLCEQNISRRTRGLTKYDDLPTCHFCGDKKPDHLGINCLCNPDSAEYKQSREQEKANENEYESPQDMQGGDGQTKSEPSGMSHGSV